MSGQVRVLSVDPPDRQPDAAGHRLTSPLGGVTCPAGPSSQTQRCTELGGDELAFAARLLRPPEVGARLSVVQFVLELGKPTPVLGPRRRVEHLAEIAD